MGEKGVSTVAVPIAVVKKKDNTPELLKKYEPFFMQLEKDSKAYNGINLHITRTFETNQRYCDCVHSSWFQQEMVDRALLVRCYH